MKFRLRIGSENIDVKLETLELKLAKSRHARLRHVKFRANVINICSKNGEFGENSRTFANLIIKTFDETLLN